MSSVCLFNENNLIYASMKYILTLEAYYKSYTTNIVKNDYICIIKNSNEISNKIGMNIEKNKSCPGNK